MQGIPNVNLGADISSGSPVHDSNRKQSAEALGKDPLSPAQRDHLTEILKTFTDRCNRKYVLGAKEHDGNLRDKGAMWLVDQAIDEAIDQVAYLVTLKNNLAKFLQVPTA